MRSSSFHIYKKINGPVTRKSAGLTTTVFSIHFLFFSFVTRFASDRDHTKCPCGAHRRVEVIFNTFAVSLERVEKTGKNERDPIYVREFDRVPPSIVRALEIRF